MPDGSVLPIDLKNAVGGKNAPTEEQIKAATRASILRRIALIAEIGEDEEAQAVQRALCKRDPFYMYDNFGWTYDPRRVGGDDSAYLPFDMWKKQREMYTWLQDRVALKEEGIIEKSRDIGFTWIAAAFALHNWMFVPGFATKFGSRKEEYVDKLGDPDSIFVKMRLLFYRLPPWLRPQGFKPADHDMYMRLINPENGNTITGEAGDQMGRGGRATVYLIDEGAFLERADVVDAALAANADVRIWGSTVNGMGNLFARKRHSGIYPVFTFGWRDDPRKNEKWAARRKRQLIDAWKWASEYEIDYAASVEDVCIPAAWVRAAIELGKMLKLPATGIGIAGGDVGGGGKGKSVYIARFGSVVKMPHKRSDGDTTGTAYWMLDLAKADAITRLNYDTIGVGAGVSSTMKNAERDDKWKGIRAVGINVGDPANESVIWPDEESSERKFANLKAELWWTLRDRLRCAFEHWKFLTGFIDEETGEPALEQKLNDIMVLPDSQELLTQLPAPKYFRTEKGKIQIESKQDLQKRGIASPDFAEALTLTMVPDVGGGMLDFFKQQSAAHTAARAPKPEGVTITNRQGHVG